MTYLYKTKFTNKVMRSGAALVRVCLWKAFQPRNVYSVPCSTTDARFGRNIHCTRFNSTGPSDEKATDDDGQQKNADTVQDLVMTGSKYSSLMDAARVQSQLSDREQFALVLKEFMSREKYRKGHVAFITMALERMEEFRLGKDLLTYNRLLDIFPKGRYQPKRLLDAVWPRPLPQTELTLELLTRMEDNGVWPDDATYSILVEVFGRRSLPVEKCERMFYWHERYKDADPYWISGEVPDDVEELSKLALKRIVDGGTITEHRQLLSDASSRKGFILSGHTVAQLQMMLDQLHSSGPVSAAGSSVLYVEGPHRIWINKSSVHYFSLRLSASDSKNDGEGAVVAVCMCQPQTQGSLQQWIKELQLEYPYLEDATIVYDIRLEEHDNPVLLDNSKASRFAASLDDAST